MDKLDKRLVNMGWEKLYKLRCHHCREYGDKRVNCPDKDSPSKIQNPQNNQDREREKCKHCGLFGHPDNKCWDLDKNIHIRPDGQIFSILYYKAQKIPPVVKARTDIAIEAKNRKKSSGE